ncbi:MAG: glycogen/starch synthase [Flavobacteriaceae bacterium]|nr:glycogen/starch synthase [Flavobacteriaceae bacterium]
MANQKILYITTEMFPYQEGTKMAESVNKAALKMHQEGNDVRVFMPRFGLVSERKFQLHEVIRLSGMNIIINDLDQPLIVKVASLPGERLQVYFIDNEEYFKRKHYYKDEEGNVFEDNDERAIFFARGVIETIKKLNWVPDIIHLNGWMSSFIAIYLKNFYKKDSYFQDTKLVFSVFEEDDFKLSKDIEEKLKFDEITELKALKKPTTHHFMAEAMDLVDLIIKGESKLSKTLEDALKSKKTQSVELNLYEEISDLYKF